jgi:hypothetical protein
MKTHQNLCCSLIGLCGMIGRCGISLVGLALSPLPIWAQGAGVAWTRFQDPFEKAFTVEVPQGWTVRGGLFRMGFSDERPMVDLTSPDGQINVRLGDISIPVYTAPNQSHARRRGI